MVRYLKDIVIVGGKNINIHKVSPADLQELIENWLKLKDARFVLGLDWKNNKAKTDYFHLKKVHF